MKIIEVTDNITRKKFIKLPYNLYQYDRKWIPHLEKDVEDVFNPAKNPVFKNGEAKRWILVDYAGKTIGRVAAFINYSAMEKMDYPCGGMGFFECMNNNHAAFLLFDACKSWLESKDIKAMEGPINFG